MDLFTLLGALGVIAISIGIIKKNRKTQDIFYILGGTLLEIYSIYLGNIIFIILQLIFTLTAIFDLIKVNIKNK